MQSCELRELLLLIGIHKGFVAFNARCCSLTLELPKDENEGGK